MILFGEGLGGLSRGLADGRVGFAAEMVEVGGDAGPAHFGLVERVLDGVALLAVSLERLVPGVDFSARAAQTFVFGGHGGGHPLPFGEGFGQRLLGLLLFEVEGLRLLLEFARAGERVLDAGL
jgi:hypothetical protein